MRTLCPDGLPPKPTAQSEPPSTAQSEQLMAVHLPCKQYLCFHKAFEQPLAGAGYAFGNRTLTERGHLSNYFLLTLWDDWKNISLQPQSNFRS
jgi:hypothetical protein